MAAPTVPESHADLLDAATAVVATVGPDGRPQLTAVWFLAREGTVSMSFRDDRQKVKNLEANPAVTFFVIDTTRPTRYLEIRGDAGIAPDPDYEFADLVGQKYDTDVRNFDEPGSQRVVVTIHPARINAIDLAG